MHLLTCLDPIHISISLLPISPFPWTLLPVLSIPLRWRDTAREAAATWTHYPFLPGLFSTPWLHRHPCKTCCELCFRYSTLRSSKTLFFLFLPVSPAAEPEELDVTLGLGSASLPCLALHQGYLPHTPCFTDEARLETLLSWNKKRQRIWVRAGTVFTVGPGKQAPRESGLQAWQTDRNTRPAFPVQPRSWLSWLGRFTTCGVLWIAGASYIWHIFLDSLLYTRMQVYVDKSLFVFMEMKVLQRSHRYKKSILIKW